MSGFYTVCEIYIAFGLILCESKTFWRKTHTNMHQLFFAYIHTKQDTYTNILQSTGPPPSLTATAKLQPVLSDL